LNATARKTLIANGTAVEIWTRVSRPMVERQIIKRLILPKQYQSGAGFWPPSKESKTNIEWEETMKKHMIKRTVITLGLLAVFAYSAVMPSLAMSAAVRSDVIAPFATKSYTITFYAGDSVEVGVSGDGRTDLDLYVYDSTGRLIAKDDDGTDECRVYLDIYRTSRWTIKVVNRGRHYNAFDIWTD
jgi:hypothetical protein